MLQASGVTSGREMCREVICSLYRLPDRIRLDLFLVPLQRKTELQAIRPRIASAIRRVMPPVTGRGCIGRSVSCVLHAYICI
jgi:hypothetical protein